MHVVVHIGPYKTGSTSIQASLRANPEELWRQGCYYFDEPHMPEFALQTLALTGAEQMTPDLRHRFPSLAAAKAWSEGCWQRFEAEVQCRRPPLTLISSEHFSGLSDPRVLIQRLRRSFSRITVLAYLRDPADLYCSTLQQRIRGNGDRLSALPSPLSFFYPARKQLEPFLNLVGAENMRVRRFGSPAATAADTATTPITTGRHDVVQDFFATLSTLGRPLSLPSHHANETLPAAVIAWVLSLNETLDDQGPGAARHLLLERLEITPEVQALPKLRFSDPSLPALIHANARPACAWLNQTFLQGQEPLPLAAADLPRPDRSPQAIAEARAGLRDWLLDQLTPEATQVISRAIVSLEPPHLDPDRPDPSDLDPSHLDPPPCP
ncbi:hypothetical protein [Pseudophaeobacter arcticus]|uniref:hypothetical protein n=1 Tax=Pseudophaeobacter arcticus TaxID=385492 RepID=UPI003A9852B8